VLHYLTKGSSKNPCILFLHGFLGSCHEWDQVVDILKSDFYCVMPDLPGHGLSPFYASSDNAFESVVADLLELMKHLLVSSCHMVGYSLGGRIALHLFKQTSLEFNSVTLLSASPGILNEDERKRRYMDDMCLADKFGSITLGSARLEFLKQWYLNPLFGHFSTCENFEKNLRSQLKNLDFKQAALALQGFTVGRQSYLVNSFSEKKMAIQQYLYGQHDLAYKRYASLFKKHGWTTKSFSSCGHAIHKEQPKQVAAFLLKTLS